MDIKLKDFEGPLDLLLHLVSKYQMDIYQVPLVEVIEQYLAYLSTLQALRLEVAGDYMVMASQLLLIKSRRLLPKLVEEAPLDEDPEQALLSQLEEYKLYKEVGQELASQHQERAQHFSSPKQELIVEDMILLQDKTGMDLFLAFSKLMAERSERWSANHTTIQKDDYRIEDLMDKLRQRLQDQPVLPLDVALAGTTSLNEAITLFLAVLELIKIKAITVEQEGNFAPVTLRWQKEKGGGDVSPG